MKCNYCNGEYSVGHRCKQMLLHYKEFAVTNEKRNNKDEYCVQDMSEYEFLKSDKYDRLIIYESQKNNNPQRKIS